METVLIPSEFKLLEVAGVPQTLVVLAMKDEATFAEIKNITGVSNASLHRALKKLEESGFITVNAKIVNGRAVKVYKLTEQSKDIAEHLKSLLKYFKKA